MQFDSKEVRVLHLPSLEIWLNTKHVGKETESMVRNIGINADYYFTEKIIKNDVSTTIAEASIDEKNIIIKRINARSILTAIRRIFGSTRVVRNWQNAAVLSQHSIDTFMPIALVKKKWWGFCYLSYLYMSKIEGVDAIAYLATCENKSQWKVVADKIISLIKKLDQLGIRHRDLNLSNIIIYEEKPYLIDLDAMKIDKKPRKKMSIKETERFIKNIEYLKEKNNELYVYFNQALVQE